MFHDLGAAVVSLVRRSSSKPRIRTQDASAPPSSCSCPPPILNTTEGEESSLHSISGSPPKTFNPAARAISSRRSSGTSLEFNTILTRENLAHHATPYATGVFRAPSISRAKRARSATPRLIHGDSPRNSSSAIVRAAPGRTHFILCHVSFLQPSRTAAVSRRASTRRSFILLTRLSPPAGALENRSAVGRTISSSHGTANSHPRTPGPDTVRAPPLPTRASDRDHA